MSTSSRRISVVTGASTGIGAAVARRLAAEGDFVYLLDIEEGQGARVARDLGKARFIRCDVTSEEEVASAVRSISSETQVLDVLVNNAGGFPTRRRLEEVTLDEWQTTVELNLTSVFLVTRALLPLLREARAGRIINVGSLAGQTAGWDTSPPYAAAKAGVHSLTRVMATELASEGINVNAVAPSAVMTDRIRGLRSEAELEATAASIPLRRYQQPEEVAAWIAFLASEEASFMTGQTLSVNGGRFMY